MRRTSPTGFLLLFFISLLGIAQESKIYTHDQKLYQDALALYNNGQYQAAQTLFTEVGSVTQDEETKANSAYFVANAAVRLNQLGADRLMEDFVETYPTSTKRNSAFIDVADYYFANGKYPYALKWYKMVDQSSMSRKDKERFNFNMGYALFSSKKPAEAERYLNKVVTSPTYGSQAKYYLGYIAYQQDDYDTANERFDQITDQDVLEEKLSYYQADMNFKLGNFEEAIAQAKKQLPKSDRREVSELNKIIGESYFNLKQYDNAIPYLEEYRGKRGRWSNTDYYLLGYSYYKQGDYANAIQQFNKIINGTNDVAQNAYYHLAECYLNLEKKQEALNAFRNASQMDFSPEIQKDAFLNYARLSYEIGNPYEPVPQVFTAYLEQYPNDEHQEEIQELLVDSYITSKNFEGAMQLLEKNRNYASDETFQKVAYFRGIELFLDGNYSDAAERFEKSLQRSVNPQFTANARFWKGESEYLLNRYDAALNDFKAFGGLSAARSTEIYKELPYHLGYTHFKLRDYGNAIGQFKSYSSSATDPVKKSDAFLRLGDSYFVSRSYWPAIEAYNDALALRGPDRDYAAYQKAMSYGFVNREGTKREELSTFLDAYPRSKLRDDALYELGNSYVQADQGEQGIAAYDRLIREYRGSSLVPAAMMRKGLVYYNRGNNQEALGTFKSVVSTYPNTQESIQAVQTAKLIYVDMGRVDEYARWVDGLDFVEVTDSELEQASYESADKQFVEGRTDAALRSFENYLRDFPNGIHANEAHFRIAQIYFSKEDKQRALPHYKAVASSGGEFGEQALTRVCEILVSQDNYPEAMPFLQRLEQSADISQNVTFAQSNLMKGYFQQKDYPKTLEYADKVLATDAIDNRIKSDAQLMIARAAWATNDRQKARSAYAEVLRIASGRTAAEALYYDALFKHEDGAYESSNTQIQKLAKDFSAYKEWGGKGLIIMAKNFDQLNDAFQATYILENVITNFAEFPEIVDEAETELQIIKTKEAQRNSSVQPNEN